VKSLFVFAVISSICSITLVFFSIPSDCYPVKEGCYEKTLTIILAIVKFNDLLIFV